MVRKTLTLAGLAVAASAFPAAAQETHPHQHGATERLGTVSFPVSCNAEAQRRFNRAVAWLHSFEYESAERTFREAAEADPTCAMAYWGVAMSQYHPLWAPPTPQELATGSEAIARARALGGGTEREQGYIAALQAFYEGAPAVDHRTRALAYEAAMDRLHSGHPADLEAGIFHALALIAAGTLDDDPEFGRERRAAALLDAALAVAPDHPGVAHYMIHSYDYPPLANLALAAARRYAGIAPASAHAQHMPSHIFTRLGLWDEAIRSNLAAERAAVAHAEHIGMEGTWDQRLHAMDYLAYAYLQTARDGDAQQVLQRLQSVERADPPGQTAAYSLSAVPARLALERRQWREAAALTLSPNTLRALPWDRFRWGEAAVHFARAVGAARSGDVEAARREVASLGTIRDSLSPAPGEYDWKKQVDIERRIAAAWLAFADGRRDEALATMRAAADLDDATEKHPVTPGSILPAREQLGELLLELGRPADALAEYENALRRAPNRFAGLYGAARAARLAGDPAKAQLNYGRLLEIARSGDGNRPELREARAELASTAR
jgi:tetratricopeptide (TPR) repeat protein